MSATPPAVNPESTALAALHDESAYLRRLAEHESHHSASEAMLSAAESIDTLLRALASRDSTIAGLRNDATSMQLQRDQWTQMYDCLAADTNMVIDGLRERLERRESAFTECERQLNILDAGAEVTVLSEIRRMQSALAAYDAALAEVRGQSEEVEAIRRQRDEYAAAGGLFSDGRVDRLLAAIDSLQLQEAANRNGFAQAKVREQGLREALQEIAKPLPTVPSLALVAGYKSQQLALHALASPPAGPRGRTPGKGEGA